MENKAREINEQNALDSIRELERIANIKITSPKLALDSLENYKSYIESQRNFVELHRTQEKISQLRILEQNRKNRLISALECEETRLIEFAEEILAYDFCKLYDDFFAKDIVIAYGQLEQLKITHIKLFDEYKKFLMEYVMTRRFIPSKEIINLRYRQTMLGKSRRYKEAQQIEGTLQILLARERASQLFQLRSYVKNKISVFLTRLRIQLNSLLERVRMHQQENLMYRYSDAKKIILRYNNVKKKLENKRAMDHSAFT